MKEPVFPVECSVDEYERPVLGHILTEFFYCSLFVVYKAAVHPLFTNIVPDSGRV